MCQEVSVETGRTAAEQSIQEDSVGITLSRLGPSGPFLGLGSFNPDAFINTRQQRDGKRLSAAYSYWPRYRAKYTEKIYFILKIPKVQRIRRKSGHKDFPEKKKIFTELELCDESNKWRRNKAWLSKSNSLYNYNSDALLHKAVCCYASICSRSSWPLLSFVNSTHSIFFYCPVQRGTIKSKLHDVAAWPNRSKTSSIFLSFDAVERGGEWGYIDLRWHPVILMENWTRPISIFVKSRQNGHWITTVIINGLFSKGQ